jgi:hypothetical protein
VTIEERKKLVNSIGEKIALAMQDFYGNIQFNIQNGKYVNANITESVKTEKQ